MKYYLYCKSKCVVNTQNQFYEMVVGGIELNENDVVNVYPLEENKLPFCFICETKYIKNNKYLKVTFYKEYTVLDIVLPELFSGEYLKIKNIKDYTLTLIGKPFKWIIDNKDENYSQTINDIITSSEFFDYKNLFILSYLVGETEKNIIFNKDSKKFTLIAGKITLKEDIVTALINKSTKAGHGRLENYRLKQNGMELISSEPVYLFGQPQKVAPFLINLAFFECVREKDYNLAKTYLSPFFAHKLTPTHFEEFFGDFTIIKPLIEKGVSKVALLHEQSENIYTAKVYLLTLENNLIVDILEE